MLKLAASQMKKTYSLDIRINLPESEMILPRTP